MIFSSTCTTHSWSSLPRPEVIILGMTTKSSRTHFFRFFGQKRGADAGAMNLPQGASEYLLRLPAAETGLAGQSGELALAE